jgi:hypothetical protein
MMFSSVMRVRTNGSGYGLCRTRIAQDSLLAVNKHKRPKLVVLDPEDFSEIALEKCRRRRKDQLGKVGLALQLFNNQTDFLSNQAQPKVVCRGAFTTTSRTAVWYCYVSHPIKCSVHCFLLRLIVDPKVSYRAGLLAVDDVPDLTVPP